MEAAARGAAVQAVNLLAAVWLAVSVVSAVLVASGCSSGGTDDPCVEGVRYWAAVGQVALAVPGALAVLVATSPRRGSSAYRGEREMGRPVRLVTVVLGLWVAATIIAL